MPRRRVLPAALGAALALAALVPSAGGQGTIGTERAAADRLRDAIAAESARIAATADGLADAEQRLATLDARAEERREQLEAAQDELIRTRIRLTRLERRETTMKHLLAENLVDTYKSGRPELTTIIFSSTGFSDLYERIEALRQVSKRSARILDNTRAARIETEAETQQLARVRARYSELARDAIADRDRANVIRNALLARQEQQLARREGAEARLASVRGRIARLERQAAAAARQAAAAETATAEAPSSSAPSSGGSSGGGASGGSADAIVARVVAAANEIATTPYVWGGGHGGVSGGYDCSGSLSYALAAAGLLESPLDSTGFMSWGEAGPGSRITVYANAGHAYMVVDGRRFDTSALSGGGTRWTSEMRSSAGFVARHPPGL